MRETARQGGLRTLRWLLSAILGLLPLAAAADEVAPVDLAIVVSLDRSESIDTDEAQGQIEGLLYTLRHSRFSLAAGTGPHGRIALTVMTWSSFGRHETLLPWVQIAGPADAAAAARLLELDLAGRRAVAHGTQTDVAFAIALGLQRLDALPWPASQRVINVVADGVSNIGHIVTVDRDLAVSRGVTVNGLIMARGSAIEVLSRYFHAEVIGGPTAFLQVSSTRQDFADAMLRKMLLEMVLLRPAPPASGGVPG